MPHVFDLKSDKKYDPNSKSVYLTEQQVKAALKTIEGNTDESKAAKTLIKKRESLHRNKLLGEIKAKEASNETKKLESDFADKFGKWSFQTDVYREFYKQFGSEELSSESFIGEEHMLEDESMEKLNDDKDPKVWFFASVEDKKQGFVQINKVDQPDQLGCQVWFSAKAVKDHLKKSQYVSDSVRYIVGYPKRLIPEGILVKGEKSEWVLKPTKKDFKMKWGDLTVIDYNAEKAGNESFSDFDLLKLENEFLCDELEFQQACQDLELIETVMNCVEQEGCVSKSIEVMFGESFSDLSNAKEELQKIYESALEVFIKDQFNAFVDRKKTDLIKKAIKTKFANLRKAAEKKGDNINFPIRCTLKNIFKLAHDLTTNLQEVSNHCAKQNWNAAAVRLSNMINGFNKDHYKGSVHVEKEDIKTYEHLQRVLRDGEQHVDEAINDVTKQAEDMRKLLSNSTHEFKKYNVNITPAHVQRVVSFSVRLIFREFLHALSIIEKAVKTGNPDRDKTNDLKIG